MTPEDVLAELSAEGSIPPRDALAAADGQREVLVDPLLQAIERGLADPLSATAQDATLFCYAVYLLAKWRETTPGSSPASRVKSSRTLRLLRRRGTSARRREGAGERDDRGGLREASAAPFFLSHRLAVYSSTDRKRTACPSA